MIRLSMAFVDNQELKGLEKVFLETVNFGLGVHVKAFEDQVASFLRTDREVIAVNTGTSALHLALEALSFPRGSEVLVPSITFVASYQAITAAGLRPISCEVHLPSGHIDVDDLDARMTPKTVAIMPVSYTGVDFDRQRLYDFAQKNRLRVIEDNAHAFGSKRPDGTMIGTIGDITCFSFDGIKNITCGEGGAVILEDRDLAHKIRVMRSLGIEKDVELRYQGKRAWDYDVAVQGFRYHMSNINAAIGSTQLTKISESMSLKANLQTAYRRALKAYDRSASIVPTQSLDPNINYHLFNVLLPPEADREELRRKMFASGIETGIHYAPNHLHSMYKTGYKLPRAEEFGQRTLSLPYHPRVTPEQGDQIIRTLMQLLG